MPPAALPSSRAFIADVLNSLPSLPQPSASATTAHTSSNPLNSAPDAAKKHLLTLHVLFPNEFLPALDLLDRHLVTRFRIRRSPNTVARAAPPDANVAPAPAPAPSASVSPRLRGMDGDRNGIEAEAARAVNSEAQRETQSAPGRSTSAGWKDAEDDPDVDMRDPVSGDAPREELTHLPRIVRQERRMQQETGSGTGGLAAQQQQQQQQQRARSDGVDTVYYVRSAQQRSSRFNASYASTSFYEVQISAWNCSCPAFAFASFPSLLPGHPEPRVDHDAEIRAHEDPERSFGGSTLGEGMPPVCKHLLACVLVERCDMFKSFVEEKDVTVEEAAGWAAGWGD